MANADQGVQAGYTGPVVKAGVGIDADTTATFVGAQTGQAAPTLQGYVKKRPVLGDTTVLTEQVRP